jgi:hypothetical protein
MGFFDKATETLRDKTRDNICAKLIRVGVEARLSERGIKEETASKPRWVGSLGLIEISKSPIDFVHVVYVQTRYGRYYSTLYLVHDLSVYYPSVHDKRPLKARSKRVKNRPVIGKVKDVTWEGNLGENIMRQLNEDQYLKQELIKLRHDVKIGTYPDISYWKIEVQGYLTKQVREKWDIYEAIAQHLNTKKIGDS